MIEELEENSNKSLADNEIASLMKTLASKKYKENSSFPKKIIKLDNSGPDDLPVKNALIFLIILIFLSLTFSVIFSNHLDHVR